MPLWRTSSGLTKAAGFLSRLARDRAGNTLMIVAFSLIPILAMIGGGIDMSRGYLAQARLQQACDSGVLAARKKLGSNLVFSSTPTSDVQAAGDQFFNLNYRNGAYGTTNRTFTMKVEGDYAISGTASVDVPTTLMKLFNYSKLGINVTCEAQINFSNTDIMMVLDTTGSMNDTNAGDSKPKIDVLRDTVKSFHAQMEGAKTPGTRIRWGFVPYSTNVNVGFLLKSSWLVDSWQYHGREPHDTGNKITQDIYQQNWTYISGTFAYGTTYVATACPSGYPVWTEIAHWFDPDGTENWTYIVNGTGYNCSYPSEGNPSVQPYTYTDYKYTYSQKKTGTKTIKDMDWWYHKMTVDVSKLKNSNPDKVPTGGKVMLDMDGSPESPAKRDAWMNGCIEERDTYEITDYANVDLTRALDLDLDLVPSSTNPKTQWRPQLPAINYAHSLTWWNWSSWNWTPAGDYSESDFILPGWDGYAACPAQAAKLAELNAAQVANYVDSLVADGNTYHDIGMIWGGRLLSPTGIFAAENADLAGRPTSRHLIFLTDGLTAASEFSYGAYGIDSLDERRRSRTSTMSLNDVIEKRFTVACNEVKKRDITVWVIGFGTSLNPVLTDCAGPGHYFEAKDATGLSATFSKIAEALGDLRISK